MPKKGVFEKKKKKTRNIFFRGIYHKEVSGSKESDDGNSIGCRYIKEYMQIVFSFIYIYLLQKIPVL